MSDQLISLGDSLDSYGHMASDSFNKGFDKWTPFLKNNAVVGILMLFLVIYASVIAPSLPAKVLNVFSYWWVKLMCFFLILYLCFHNATLALACAIAVFMSIYALNKYVPNENMAPVSNNADDLSGIMYNSNLQMKTSNVDMLKESIYNDSQDNERNIEMSFYNKLKSKFLGTENVVPVNNSFVSLHEESLSGVSLDNYEHKKSKLQRMSDDVKSLFTNKSNISSSDVHSACSSVVEKNKSSNYVDGYDESPIYNSV